MKPDFEGTTPGLTQPESPKALNLKCRRDGCKSITAIEITQEGFRGRRYQCVDCKHTWVIDVGGSFII